MTCKNCQRHITAKKRAGTKFCSTRCRMAAHRARHAKVQPDLMAVQRFPEHHPIQLDFIDPPPSLPPGTKGSRLERLILRIAPPRAVGYRLGFPDYRARVVWYPCPRNFDNTLNARLLCFCLRPFEIPTLPCPGTYQLEFLDARGSPISRSDWPYGSGVHIRDEAFIDRSARVEAGDDHWEDDGSWTDPEY